MGKYKCARCNEFFRDEDGIEIIDERYNVFAKIQGIRLLAEGNPYFQQANIWPEAEIYLCPECIKELLKFLNINFDTYEKIYKI